jgi:integrase
VALDTGLRQSELLRLEWRDVDAVRRLLVVRESKSGRPREVPLTTRAFEMLEQLRAGRMVTPLDGADRVFAAIPQRIGGKDLRGFKLAARTVGCPTLRFHDLRHLFGSNLAQAGVPIPDIAKLLGHSTIAMALRYASHTPTDSATRSITRLERHLGLPSLRPSSVPSSSEERTEEPASG